MLVYTIFCYSLKHIYVTLANISTHDIMKPLIQVTDFLADYMITKRLKTENISYLLFHRIDFKAL